MRNPFFYRFPYTNLNDINLDWIIKKVKILQTRVDNLDPEDFAERLEAVEAQAEQASTDAAQASTDAAQASTDAAAAVSTANSASIIPAAVTSKKRFAISYLLTTISDRFTGSATVVTPLLFEMNHSPVPAYPYLLCH